MNNFTYWLVDDIKSYVASEDTLKDLKFDVSTGYKANNKTFPKIVIQQILNSGVTYSRSNNEIMTNIGFQISIYSKSNKISGSLYKAGKSCDYIANLIAYHMENDLKLKRTTYTPPIPTNDSDTMFASFLRYTGKYDVHNDTISR